MSTGQCTGCGSTTIDYDSSAGHFACTRCGMVTNDNNMTSELTFAENAGGSASVVGQFLSRDGRTVSGTGIIKREARDITLQTGKKKIQNMIARLTSITGVSPSSLLAEQAHRLFSQALQAGYARGRRSVPVLCSCIYIACVRANEPYMLIDLAEITETHVYELSDCATQLARNLGLQLVSNDPSIFVHRYASQMELGPMTHQVSRDALKILRLMEHDWITIGRRPNGLCAAALLLSARAHGFQPEIHTIADIVKVNPSTISTRLAEMSNSPQATLTLTDLRTHFDGQDLDSTPLARMTLLPTTTSTAVSEHGNNNFDDDADVLNNTNSVINKNDHEKNTTTLFTLAPASDPPSFHKAVINRTRIHQWRLLLLENEYLAEILIQNTAFYRTNDYGDGDLRTLAEMSLSKLIKQIYFQLRQSDKDIHDSAPQRMCINNFFQEFRANPHPYHITQDEIDIHSNNNSSNTDDGIDNIDTTSVDEYNEKSIFLELKRQQFGFAGNDFSSLDDLNQAHLPQSPSSNSTTSKLVSTDPILKSTTSESNTDELLVPTWIGYLRYKSTLVHRNQEDNASGKLSLLKSPSMLKSNNKSTTHPNTNENAEIKTKNIDSQSESDELSDNKDKKKSQKSSSLVHEPATKSVDQLPHGELINHDNDKNNNTQHIVSIFNSSSAPISTNPSLAHVRATLAHLYYQHQLQYNPYNDPTHRLANININDIIDENVINAVNDALQAKSRSLLADLRIEAKAARSMASESDITHQVIQSTVSSLDNSSIITNKRGEDDDEEDDDNDDEFGQHSRSVTSTTTTTTSTMLSTSITPSGQTLVEFNSTQSNLIFPPLPTVHMFSSNPTSYMNEERLLANNEIEFQTLMEQAVSEIKLWNEEKGYSLEDIDDDEIDQLILTPEERQVREFYWEQILQRTHGITRQPKVYSSEHGEGRKIARSMKIREEEQRKKIDFSLLTDNDDDSLFDETEQEQSTRFTSISGFDLLSTNHRPQVNYDDDDDEYNSDLFDPSESEAVSRVDSLKRQRFNQQNTHLQTNSEDDWDLIDPFSDTPFKNLTKK